MKLISTIGATGQMTSAQIRRAIFPNCKSRTSADNRLRRLTATDYLHRVESARLVGGAKGGGGAYAYTLGRRGFQMFHEGVWRPTRNISYHTLLIVETWLVLRDLASTGTASLDYWAMADEVPYTDESGQQVIKPDLVAHMTQDGVRRFYWFEIDMATEGTKQIKDKLVRAWHAMTQTNETEYPTAPVVVWVACDDERAKELSYIIDQGAADKKQYFRVCTIDQLTGVVS